MEKYLTQYPPILTVKEVASILGVCEPLVRQLINEHKLPALKVGRLVKIPKEQLINYINSSI